MPVPAPALLAAIADQELFAVARTPSWLPRWSICTAFDAFALCCATHIDAPRPNASIVNTEAEDPASVTVA